MEAEAILAQVFCADNGVGDSFVALAGTGGLRWILPARKSAIAHTLAAWRPYGLTSHLKWNVVIAAVRSCLLHTLPGSYTFKTDFSGVDWSLFGWKKRVPPLVAFYVGTPGPTRKLVAFLADRADGAAHVVVKFPLEAAAWPRIAYEYTVLQELARGERARAPAPLQLNPQQQFSCQSWIFGKPPGLGFTHGHTEFAASLLRPDRKVELAAFRAKLAERSALLAGQNALPMNLRQEIDHILSKGDWSGRVSAARLHGDFAPWNLRQLPNGEIAAVDWEESEPEGLPFYDLHYYEQQVMRLLGRRVEIPWRDYMRALGMQSNTCFIAARAMAMLALVELNRTRA